MIKYLSLLLVIASTLMNMGCQNMSISQRIINTRDIKTFSFQNGEIKELQSKFEVVEFDRKFKLDSFEFNTWEPNSLETSAVLQEFWKEELSNYDMYMKYAKDKRVSGLPDVDAIPEGWRIDKDNKVKDVILLDPVSGKTIEYDNQKRGLYFDKETSRTIGFYIGENSYSCWDRNSGELFWRVSNFDEGELIFKNEFYIIKLINKYLLAKQNIENGEYEWAIKFKDNVNLGFWHIKASTKYLWFHQDNQLYRFDIEKMEITEVPLLDGKEIYVFISNNNIYIIDSKGKLSKINEVTLEKRFVQDLSKFIFDDNGKKIQKLELNNLSNYLTISNDKGRLFLNKENDQLIEKLGNDDIYAIIDDQLYAKEGTNIYGINQATLEKTWSIKIDNLGSGITILLVDSRGVILRDDKYIYGFKP